MSASEGTVLKPWLLNIKNQSRGLRGSSCGGKDPTPACPDPSQEADEQGLMNKRRSRFPGVRGE